MEQWNIAAGELRHRVIIEAKTADTTDSRGHPVRTWATSIENVAAKIETPTGRKMEIARQLVATATHIITMRYRVLSARDNRINFNGRIFNIGFQQNVEERNVRLELTCTELVDAP